MDINELESFKLSDAVAFHKELNPKLWEDDRLDPKVRDQLLLIAEDFVEYLGISNLKVRDVTVSGSNAAYSYTPHSDLDLHVLVDFNDLPNNEVYQELFTAKKTLYNDAHDITVRDVPVELYVQDTNNPVQSLGEYSIVHDKWIRIPKKRRANFDQTATKLKYEKLGDLIELALQSEDSKKVNDTIALIKRYRKSGLDKAGEFGPENLAYKAVRKQGLVQALHDLKAQLHTEKLSIDEADELDEDFTSKQQVINYFVSRGKSAAQGAAAWERGWRGAKPKQAKLYDPERYKNVRLPYIDEAESDVSKASVVQFKTLPGPGEPRHSFRVVYDGKVIAYGEVEKDSVHDDEHGASVQEIVVHSRYRRMGIASKIYSAIEHKFGYELHPSDDVRPDGQEFWRARGNLDEADDTLDVTFTQEPYEGWNGMGAMITASWAGNDIGHVIFEPTDHDKNKWYATEVEVEDQFQRKGIATTMYDMAKKLAKKSNAVIIPSHAQTADAKGMWKNKKVWEASGTNLVYRVDKTKIPNFEKNLKTYHHNDDWSMSGSEWEGATGSAKGLYAHPDKLFVALYAAGTPETNRYVATYNTSPPMVYFDKKDVPKFKNTKSYLTAFDASTFKKVPSGEVFSDMPGKPVNQIEITDPFKFIKQQGWGIKLVDDLPAKLKEIKKIAKEKNIKYGAEGMDMDLHEASGYIPSAKEKNDPRFKTALTVDVKPDANKKNAAAFGWKVSRAGIPPQARADGKIAEDLMREFKTFLGEQQEEMFPGYDEQHREKRLSNWLAKSWAVKDGKPQTFYHATTKDFDTFNMHGTGFASALGMAYEVERHGSFFAVDPKFAEGFIEDPNTGRVKEGGRVLPVHLSIQSPIDLRDDALSRMLSDEETVEEFKANDIDLRSIYNHMYELERWELFDGPEGAEFIDNLQKLGFDGAIINESIPNDSNAKSGQVWVAFSPNQVKSIHNRGSFSPDDSRLTKESG